MAYKNPEDTVAYNKAYYEANKEKKAAYYKANEEKIKAYRDANKEKMKALAKAWEEANKEKRKAQNKEWTKKNKDKVCAKLAKRRAAKINRTPGWLTKEDLDKIVSIYIEAGRKTKKTGEEWHVDHIIPLQGENISGLHVPDNLQVIRAKDNLSKNNRYEV